MACVVFCIYERLHALRERMEGTHERRTEKRALMKNNERTQRTLEELRQAGFTAEKCEHFQFSGKVIAKGMDWWNNQPKHRRGSPGVRQDVFGFGDIICMREGWGIGLVQCTSKKQRTAHKAAILANKNALKWLQSNGRILLFCWSQEAKKARGAKIFWTSHLEELTLDAFNDGPF